MPHEPRLCRAQARENVLRGASVIADAVRVTLAPRCRSDLIERKWRKPIVCNNGVTIARAGALWLTEETLTERPEPTSEAERPARAGEFAE
jgi:chaperonin GroEL